MSTINYDPDDTPSVPPELIATARENDLHIVNVICDEHNRGAEEPLGVSFVAAVPFLPRVGDRITLEDERTCEVTRVYFKVSRLDSQPVLVPNVYALLLGE